MPPFLKATTACNVFAFLVTLFEDAHRRVSKGFLHVFCETSRLKTIHHNTLSRSSICLGIDSAAITTTQEKVFNIHVKRITYVYRAFVSTTRFIIYSVEKLKERIVRFNGRVLILMKRNSVIISAELIDA